MNILLIGSGGREHALAWAISASPLCDTLFIAPGNPGTAHCGENVVIYVADHAAVVAFCRLQAIDLVVVGPEGPLVAGIADDLRAAGIKVFGPSKAAAQLEGSKGFTKELCAEFNIPTAGFGRFADAASAKIYVAAQGAPIVIKADGLAAGKGVIMAETLDAANEAIDMMFSGSFGAAGAEVVIEEWMIGEEASFFALCDGKHALALASAQDHKRVGDGDTGPNTGGMGAYSPAPVMTAAMTERVMAEIIRPTLAGMAKRGTPFQGVLFAGLMITAQGPKLIEYNTRFGDPECEVLMPRLKSDILPALLAACDGVLDRVDLRWHDEVALTVVLAAKGYPAKPETGSVIQGVEKAEALDDVLVFHAGTKLSNGDLVANGGRVLNVVALGKSVGEAQKRAYEAVDKIDWPGGFCRRDIGWQAVKREQG
ncbi:MAG: phosphoribosylamine--glycine ligase [Bosea sp.]|uniref:phosphoribosylamine--glycine ligase n=1 Tax=Bosea sp. (in: a-proteobacteria) TaxID=1871050 RepID=UPI001AC8D5D0|nr:phosphoribosylamine--glycine ligase [Bosea sp. (in: a-proteobacteria)]MBN9450897.1 phosphoribosylamine--glycine ligase [Bosea sp. (in: a-proteobacteria)]